MLSSTFAKIDDIYKDIYDTQLHFQNFMRANINWMVDHIWPTGRSLDTHAVTVWYSSLRCSKLC